MRTWTSRLAAIVAAAAVASPAAAASHRPQIRDPKGDFGQAALDIVSARFSTDLAAKELVGELTLAAVPVPGPGTYVLGFSVGCVHYRFTLRALPEVPRSAAMEYGCGNVHESPSTQGVQTVVASITGSTITWRVPLDDQVKLGTPLRNLVAVTYAGPTLVFVGMNPFTGLNGDFATGPVGYVVGSEHRRRAPRG